MTTLYIRDVPEAVAQTLKERAAAQGQSMSAYINAQLALIASRPSNLEIAARLRLMQRAEFATTEQILDALEDSRR